MAFLVTVSYHLQLDVQVATEILNLEDKLIFIRINEWSFVHCLKIRPDGGASPNEVTLKGVNSIIKTLKWLSRKT